MSEPSTSDPTSEPTSEATSEPTSEATSEPTSEATSETSSNKRKNKRKNKGKNKGKNKRKKRDIEVTKKIRREKDRIDKRKKRSESALGLDFVTYNYSLNWKKEVKEKFFKLGYVFVRGVFDPLNYGLIDSMIEDKIKSIENPTKIMGETKTCELYKGQKPFDFLFDRVKLVFDELIGYIYPEESEGYRDIYLLEKLLLMMKDAKCSHAQLPHADSIGDDIRMIIFTRYVGS
jgi:hypothetical protein